MKKYFLAFLLLLLNTTFTMAQNNQTIQKEKTMDRIALCKKQYTELFKTEALKNTGTDIELMHILQKFIFGEIFFTGNLDVKTREMITIVSLSTQQTLPQLKSHINAALNIGVTPIAIREAIYQCAPFIGFPKTLNAIAIMNEVFKEKNITLPLENQTTVQEEQRYKKGYEIQYPLYGDEIKEKMKNLPDSLGEAIAQLLTEMCFGDFYTRKGLDIKTRELLSLCILTTLGIERQINSHAMANLKVGNQKETLYAAMIQCIPYIGFPKALNAINIIQSIQ